MNIPAKTVLITGASSGIGFELAKLFARDGYSLVLVSRGADTLEAAATNIRANTNVAITTIPKDLSLPGAAEELVRELKQKNISIDILVNNAGVGVYGNFSDTSLAQELSMMQLNMNALTILTKELLPHMQSAHSGKILNVASTAAFEPGPTMAVYFATKAFVLSLSEALNEELRGSGVTVTALCPGPTKTRFEQNAGATASALFSGSNIMSAEKVARLGYRALMQSRPLVITGLKNRLMIFALRFAPRRIVPRVVKKAME